MPIYRLLIKTATGGDDIATEDNIDFIPIKLNQVAKEARIRKFLRNNGYEPLAFPINCRYGQTIPYKFYDTALFAESLNDLFVQ